MDSDVIYHVSVFVIASLAGVSRVLSNGNYRSAGHCLAVSCMSGAVGFGIIGILMGGRYLGTEVEPIFFLGLAAIIGVSGKEQIEYLSAVHKWFRAKFGIGIDDGNK